jgi:phosphohistidine phosphatase
VIVGILLVRHAEAVEEQPGSDDAGRWLSARGRAQAREVAHALSQKGLALRQFVASPRVRAVQTAELFAQVLGFLGEVEVLPTLSYTEPPERAASALAKLGAARHVAAFGHMPTIAGIASRLCATPHPGLSLAQALWIDEGRVVWSLAPR